MLPIAYAMKKRSHAREHAFIWLEARCWTVAILLRAMVHRNGLPDARMGRDRIWRSHTG
jgi:hypothetical protein